MPAGEIFLSAFVQVLLRQLTSGATMALARREKVESHFKNLSLNLSMIQAVLDDAEKRRLTENTVGVWLELLRDLASDLDDILDEITTRALIQEYKGIQHNSMVWKFIRTCSSYTPGALMSSDKKMSKIKGISNRLQFLVRVKNELNLRENSGDPPNQFSVITLPSTSLVDESNVCGRDEDKKNVMELLFGDEAYCANVSVIPIVGMGGIGKTTLAQLVYNDNYIWQYFDVRVWVCVSEEFDVISITKTIYEAVTGMSGQSKDLDRLQVSLKEKLAMFRFLIVLDNVWNENYGKWDHLFRPFQFGLRGSRIIVTTRNDIVASVVGSSQTVYHMTPLTDEYCLFILFRHACLSLDQNPEFREVGLGLAKKCKGLPSTAKTLGRLLRSKTREEWEDVLNNVLPDLRLSYLLE